MASGKFCTLKINLAIVALPEKYKMDFSYCAINFCKSGKGYSCNILETELTHFKHTFVSACAFY